VPGIAALVALLAFNAAATAADGALVVRSTKGSFEDVKERVESAIESRGLVLNYTARIGAMLERTGKDIGAAKRVFEHAESLEFCSASVSRETMEVDPHNIGFCPYVINIYVLPREPGRVYVSYRKFPPSRAMRPAEKLVAEIVREALK
jgi:uncharacterized protein (DUF302 family)